MKKNIIYRTPVKTFVYSAKYNEKKKGINYQNLKVNKNYKNTKITFKFTLSIKLLNVNILIFHIQKKEKNEKKKSQLLSFPAMIQKRRISSFNDIVELISALSYK